MDEIMNEILSNPHDELSIAKNLVLNYSPQVLEIALKLGMDFSGIFRLRSTCMDAVAKTV